MPILKNVKHESFAQQMVRGLAVGWSPADAYAAAGYKPASRHAAEVCASRLLSKVEVRDRIAELQAAGARKATVTVASLIEELEEARAAAQSAEQYSAAVSAITTKAKISGLMTDKLQIVDQVAQAQTIPELVDIMIHDTFEGDMHGALALIDDFREEVLRRLADQARPALPAPRR